MMKQQQLSRIAKEFMNVQNQNKWNGKCTECEETVAKGNKISMNDIKCEECSE